MAAALRLFLTFALAGSSAGYLLSSKQVTLKDSGQVRRIQTFAPTVGDALRRLGISLGDKDKIYPSPQVSLAHEKAIEVRRARDVVVVLNGSRSVERVSGATVAQILDELSVVPTGAFLQPPLAAAVRPGEEIVVAQPVSVNVVHDGTLQPVVTNVLTAGALLRQMGILLGDYDRVEPSIVAYPAAGSTIKVIRVSETSETKTSPIAFKKVIEKTDALELGVRKVKTAGVEGVRSKVYRVLFEDGRVRSRELVSTSVVKEPRDEIVLVGTRRPVLETAGNLQTGKASWYRIQGLTAAHRTLPFGTVVKVTNVNNGRVVTVVIRDRGPFIEGRIIDLSEQAFAEIAPLSAGVVPVKIEW